MICAMSVLAPFAFHVATTSADDTGTSANVKQQVDTLNAQIKQNRSKVGELQGLIDKYHDKIQSQESQTASLQNEVAILENRIAQKLLDIEQIKAELEATRLEIISLETQIGDQNDRIARQKDDAAALIQQIHQNDNVSIIEVLLSKPTLSSFFDRLEEDKRVERDLGTALDKVKSIKIVLEATKKERDDKRHSLEDEKRSLNKESLALEAERNFKASLADETKNKEDAFQRVLYELQQQQQSTSDDISSLETKLKDKLDAVDQALARGDVLLNWPVDPSKGITAKFHDPSYPFRNLFPHPGVDIRASVGTVVRAAAGGYVAWNKTGRMYGNYLMIVHPGNIATVYAHLSKFIAKPDTYIERGDVIGLSGGMPGQPGAGLSTGPHVHFEVRQDGVPVDPENFLPASGADEQ